MVSQENFTEPSQRAVTKKEKEKRKKKKEVATTPAKGVQGFTPFLI